MVSSWTGRYTRIQTEQLVEKQHDDNRPLEVQLFSDYKQPYFLSYFWTQKENSKNGKR